MAEPTEAEHPYRRWLFPGVGALVLLALVGIFYLSTNAVSTPTAPVQQASRPAPSPVPLDHENRTQVQQLSLRTEAHLGGRTAIVDADGGRTLRIIEAGGEGFMLTVLRIMALDRRNRDVDPQAPFLLTRWSDQSLSLEDPQTGLRYELNAFGSSNAAAFARLFDAAHAAQ